MCYIAKLFSLFDIMQIYQIPLEIEFRVEGKIEDYLAYDDE